MTGHLPRTSGLTPPVARCPAQCAYAAWQMVLMDAGGELHGYASDITRTWPVRGRFSAAQAELYEAALAVNKACIQVPAAGLLGIRTRNEEGVEWFDHRVVAGVWARVCTTRGVSGACTPPTLRIDKRIYRAKTPNKELGTLQLYCRVVPLAVHTCA